MNTQQTRSEHYIDVLDGIRAISLIFIVWFHIWEQSWLTPYIEYNNVFTRYFGITQSNLHLFVKFGYLFVDWLIIISAIVNFLPYAESIFMKTPWPDMKKYYKKRAIRIIPSYLLCVLIMFIVAVSTNAYAVYEQKGFAFKDVITHLTFTSIYFKDVYRTSQLNGALWTVQVEIVYYLLMPFLAVFFKKKPVATICSMFAVGVISSNILLYHAKDTWACNNFVTTFASDYAVGMVICMVYCFLSKDRDKLYLKTAGIISALTACISFIWMLERFNTISRPEGQLYYRFELALLFGAMTLGIMFAPDFLRRFFGNRFFRFISMISYNLYIWHQVVALWLKKLRIPAWSGETAPNELGDVVWGRKYTFLCVIVALIFATLITYIFDIPVTKRLALWLKVSPAYKNSSEFGLKTLLARFAISDDKDDMSQNAAEGTDSDDVADAVDDTDEILDLDEMVDDEG